MEIRYAKPDPEDDQQKSFPLKKFLVDAGGKQASEQSRNSDDQRDREAVHEAPHEAMGVKKGDPRPNQDAVIGAKKTDGDGNRDDEEQKQVTHRDSPVNHRR